MARAKKKRTGIVKLPESPGQAKINRVGTLGTLGPKKRKKSR